VPVDIGELHVGDCLRMRNIKWDSVGAKPLRYDPAEPIFKVAGSRSARAALKAAAAEE